MLIRTLCVSKKQGTEGNELLASVLITSCMVKRKKVACSQS